MTIIAAIISDDQPVYLLSDVAISGGSNRLNSEAFPIHLSGVDGFINLPRVENDLLSATSQKMIFFGRHAIMWSGDWLLARTIVRHLFSQRFLLNPCNFELFVNDVARDRLDKVDLIYVYDPGNAGARIVTIGCQQRTYGSIKIVASGTGSVRILDEFDRENFGIQLQTTFQQASARLMHLLEKEIIDTNAYYYGIGVGYEVGFLTLNGWKKTPYCLGIYGHSEDSFSLKKAISTFYYRDILYLFTMTCSNQENWNQEGWAYIPNEVKISGFATFPVSHLLGFECDPLQSWNRLDISDEDSLVEPVFNLTLMEAHAKDESGDAIFGKISRIPAALGVVKSGEDFVIASRAFFRREVEEFYMGRDFVPPPGQVDFYARQAADQAAGLAMTYPSK